MNCFSDKLRELRQNNNFTLEELAEKLNISKSFPPPDRTRKHL